MDFLKNIHTGFYVRYFDLLPGFHRYTISENLLENLAFAESLLRMP